MTFYLFFADRHGTSAGARWATMGFAVKVAQSVSSTLYLPILLEADPGLL
jgi:hypothetical protein